MKSSGTRSRVLFVAASLIVLSGRAAAGDEALRWNRIATQVGEQVYELDPLTESRTLAMMHVAVHDALNAVERLYEGHTSSETAARAARRSRRDRAPGERSVQTSGAPDPDALVIGAGPAGLAAAAARPYREE